MFYIKSINLNLFFEMLQELIKSDELVRLLSPQSIPKKGVQSSNSLEESFDLINKELSSSFKHHKKVRLLPTIQ